MNIQIIRGVRKTYLTARTAGATPRKAHQLALSRAVKLGADEPKTYADHVQAAVEFETEVES